MLLYCSTGLCTEFCCDCPAVAASRRRISWCGAPWAPPSYYSSVSTTSSYKPSTVVQWLTMVLTVCPLPPAILLKVVQWLTVVEESFGNLKVCGRCHISPWIVDQSSSDHSTTVYNLILYLYDCFRKFYPKYRRPNFGQYQTGSNWSKTLNFWIWLCCNFIPYTLSALFQKSFSQKCMV